MAAAVSAAALEGPASALRPFTPSETLSCTAVELPLRYHTLPTEADLIRTRDSDDFFAPGMLPTGCTGDGSEVGPRIRVGSYAGSLDRNSRTRRAVAGPKRAVALSDIVVLPSSQPRHSSL